MPYNSTYSQAPDQYRLQTETPSAGFGTPGSDPFGDRLTKQYDEDRAYQLNVRRDADEDRMARRRAMLQPAYGGLGAAGSPDPVPESRASVLAGMGNEMAYRDAVANRDRAARLRTLMDNPPKQLVGYGFNEGGAHYEDDPSQLPYSMRPGDTHVIPKSYDMPPAGYEGGPNREGGPNHEPSPYEIARRRAADPSAYAHSVLDRASGGTPGLT